MSIEQKFIDGFKDYYSKSRINSQFYNCMIEKNRFLRVHPIDIPSGNSDVLISFADSDSFIYPSGDDLQHEVFQFVQKQGWHTFMGTGFSDEEMVEFLPETRYIETSRFTKIELSVPTWDDLINAPKVGDAEFSIMKETFEEYHGIEDDYELTCESTNLFYDNEKKPEELELRVVFDDTDSNRKYGHGTILVFWKGEFMALCNECIERYRQNHSFYITDVPKWREMMKVLFELANIEPTSPVRGAEILDMTQDVEQIAAVPGFTEKCYE